MLEPVVRAGEYGSAFIPDNLLMVEKADPQQTVENLAGELRRMPNVRHLEARHQCERVRPIGSRVTAYGGLVVTFGPVLHIAGFGRPAAIQAGAVTPFGIEFNTVRRVGDHQPRLALAEQPPDRLGRRGVAAKYSVIAQEP
jgi:hypothetical protein